MKAKKMIIAVFSVAALFAVSIADASAASSRVRCSKSASGSKVSVDLRDAMPGEQYKAIVISGLRKKVSGFKDANGDGESEFDFDSKPADIAAGATPIGAGFITGAPLSVTAKVRDRDGFLVASDTVVCRAK